MQSVQHLTDVTAYGILARWRVAVGG